MEDEFEMQQQVGRWASLDEADERALVVLAMNLDCRVSLDGSAFVLEVDESNAEAVERELSLYEKEKSDFRAVPEAVGYSPGLEVAGLWVAALVAVHLRQMIDPGITDRFLNSAVDVWQRGEWWRPFTALFLHADAEHLLGNLGIGGFFCLMVATAFRRWRGWLLILLTGYLGNLANAWIHLPGPFFSLGASTATFGALGLVVGNGLARVLRTHRFGEMKRLLVPLGVGLGLFGWFGIGGADTDVAAHLLGGGFGVVIGAVCAGLPGDAGSSKSPHL